MSTDGPGELRLAAGQAPNATETPRGGPPSPGVALAGARVPGAPTVPDWDPMTLTTLVQRMASELFTAPPAPEPSSPDEAAMGAGAVPAATPSAPSPEAAATT
ncbi:MAG TPA: hypothetical protein VHE35_29615, partial [Kofleriaceae bacterium]|nr:hypothetical protein [Kofleriaceae bacterium]